MGGGIKAFRSWHLAEVGGGRVQRGVVFRKIYVTGTGTSTNKIENLGEIKKEHLVFKYAESYGS